MSRIHQAWTRASLGPHAEAASRTEEPRSRAVDDAWHDPPGAEDAVAPGGTAAGGPDEWYRPVVVARTFHPAFDRRLVVSRRTAPTAVEQYRRLAGALEALQAARGVKTVMVTSAVPGEGKTLTVANLALTLSEACERRVLLIDADLRRPFVHEVFRLQNTRGLSEALGSPSSELTLAQVSDRLCVLPAGRAGHTLALGSERMRGLLHRAAAAFDWVLLDAAPAGFMPDAELLARVAGAVLFVIAAGSTPYALVRRTIGTLDPECVVGVVLNRVDAADIPAASYYRNY